MHQLIYHLIVFDRKLFHYINGTWHTPLLDVLMPFIRNPFTWAPLYLFLLLFVCINFKWRGLVWILFFLISFAIADQLSVEVFKMFVQRLRPCHDPVVAPTDRLLISCGGQYGFPSAHATNHFALAMFMFLSFRRFTGKWLWIVFFWAFLISYAQVYVGVHFPGDIFAGILLGLLIGTVTGTIFVKFFPLRSTCQLFST
ncbi:MAG: phosphatase PAP2 family protein [Thermoflavifilum sp.]|nr:phosphatase PAP2 family protein [Thermoflavifilum sp.]